MSCKFREISANHRVEHFLVHDDSEKVREVVKRQVLLDNLAKCPEGVLFRSHLRKEVGCDKVHSLRVADFGVSFDERIENVTQL